MATVTVVRKDPAPPPIEKVILELSANEAKNLVSKIHNGGFALEYCSGGDSSVREISNMIARELA